MHEVPIGAQGRSTTLVTDDMSTDRGGTYRVLSTAALVKVCELVANDSILPFLESGETTVGAKVDLDHTAPTIVGQTVTATSKVTAVEKRRISFEVEVHDGVEVVGRARHQRFVADLDRANARLNAKAEAARLLPASGHPA